ncbi:MAG: fimbria/pilus periplasmic chaperone [Oligoflexia bacterium]|nr:fimbria/pilus periplasmic chaperone [Oligoflexia bacterium]
MWFLALLLLVPASGFASFDFSPIVANLTPTGSGASASFIVQNGEETKLPVQISIVHRNPDTDGKEEHVETPDIDEMIQVYPAQLVLGPKERRTVRITWVGDPKPKAELAFRMIAEELPFSLEEDKKSNKPVARVRIATKYVGSLYVRPAGAAPQIVIKGESTKDKQPRLSLEIQNVGTAHRVLEGLKLKLTPVAGGTEYSFTEPQLNFFARENVLAGRTRRYVLDWPKGFPIGPVKVDFELPRE